jgi:hypothetical protein
MLLGCCFLQPFVYSALYPMQYRDVILACEKEFDVPAPIICAVIRQESRFHADAVSSAGAFGLMQLTKATFRELSAEQTTFPVSSGDGLRRKFPIVIPVIASAFAADYKAGHTQSSQTKVRRNALPMRSLH